jgi:Zn-dependent protease
VRLDNPTLIVISIVVILLSIALHEFAHAKFADAAGDPTPRNQGRVTLNPLAHLDPIGTIMIIVTSLTGFGIGWGKPVMVDPRKMRNPRWDHFVSVIAGPATNLLLAAFCAILLRLVAGPNQILEIAAIDRLSAGVLPAFLFMGTIINLALCIFNLIPVGPLDGHWLVGTFMPEPTRTQWYQFNRGPGALIFIVLVLMPSGSPLDLFGKILQPAVSSAARFFLGI